jgi:hypothetical protein
MDKSKIREAMALAVYFLKEDVTYKMISPAYVYIYGSHKMKYPLCRNSFVLVMIENFLRR